MPIYTRRIPIYTRNTKSKIWSPHIHTHIYIHTSTYTEDIVSKRKMCRHDVHWKILYYTLAVDLILRFLNHRASMRRNSSFTIKCKSPAWFCNPWIVVQKGFDTPGAVYNEVSILPERCTKRLRYQRSGVQWDFDTLAAMYKKVPILPQQCTKRIRYSRNGVQICVSILPEQTDRTISLGFRL